MRPRISIADNSYDGQVEGAVHRGGVPQKLLRAWLARLASECLAMGLGRGLSPGLRCWSHRRRLKKANQDGGGRPRLHRLTFAPSLWFRRGKPTLQIAQP